MSEPEQGSSGTAGAPAAPAGTLPVAGALEAVLLVVDQPVPTALLASVIEHPEEETADELHRLAAGYERDRRGFRLREVAGGWRLYTAEEYAEVVERYVVDGAAARLSQAALETLAIVAYRQPVSRARVGAIRGVNVDGVMRTLVARGMVEECGREGEGGAVLYQTTGLFLERLGLQSLTDLPPLANLVPDVESIHGAEGSGSRGD